MADGVDAVKALAEALKVLDFTPKNNNFYYLKLTVIFKIQQLMSICSVI